MCYAINILLAYLGDFSASVFTLLKTFVCLNFWFVFASHLFNVHSSSSFICFAVFAWEFPRPKYFEHTIQSAFAVLRLGFFAAADFRDFFLIGDRGNLRDDTSLDIGLSLPFLKPQRLHAWYCQVKLKLFIVVCS